MPNLSIIAHKLEMSYLSSVLIGKEIEEPDRFQAVPRLLEDAWRERLGQRKIDFHPSHNKPERKEEYFSA